MYITPYRVVVVVTIVIITAKNAVEEALKEDNMFC
jgi:hypothetical protein